MILNKNLLVILRDRVYLHSSHQGFDSRQLQSGLYGKWTVNFNDVKSRGADGNKTLLEEMKHMQLVAVYLFI